MNVSAVDLMQAEDWSRALRTVAALRHHDPGAFREVMAYAATVLAHPAARYDPEGFRNGGKRRTAWRVFLWGEFARDASNVPEAAAAKALADWIARLKAEELRVLTEKRREAAKKARATRRKNLGDRAEDWQAGRRRSR